MGFLKSLGEGIGIVTGTVVGGVVKAAGEALNSDFVKEIGDGVEQASKFAGKTIGTAASGAWDLAAGVITDDEKQLNAGLKDLGGAVGSTAKAAGSTIKFVAEQGVSVVDGVISGDTDRALGGAKQLAKAAAVATLSIGVVDLIDGVDGVDGETSDSSQVAAEPDVHIDNTEPAHTNTTDTPPTHTTLVENPNSHHVEPHWRHLPDGNVIWVDGDGDTSVNTGTGWVQSNPDYQMKS